MSREGSDRARRRERTEPEELSSPVPRPLFVFMIAMIAWGAWYYFQNTGFPTNAGDRRSAIVKPVAGAVDGATVYAGNCVACHQANGAGLTGVFPTLVNSRWVTGSEERLVQILLHGIQGEIEVQGVTYNGVMPAFPQLADAELAAVLSYIRGEWGNDAAPVSAEAIAAGREREKAPPGPWAGGAALDAAFPPDDG